MEGIFAAGTAPAYAQATKLHLLHWVDFIPEGDGEFKRQVAVRAAARLRREAETTPPAALASVVVRALELTDRVCWDALARGRDRGVRP